MNTTEEIIELGGRWADGWRLVGTHLGQAVPPQRP